MDSNKTGTRTLRSVRPQEPIRLPVQPKKSPVFWYVFGGIMLLLILVLIAGLSVLHLYLRSYEASRSIYKAEQVFDQYFADGDFTEAVRMSGLMTGGFEDASTVAASLREQGRGMELIHPYEVRPAKSDEENAGKKEEEPARAYYSVAYADELVEERSTKDETVFHRNAVVKVATMVLTQTGEDLGFGFRGWELDHLEMDLKGKESVTVTVPRGVKVILNGKEVPEDYLVSSEASPYNDYLPDGTEGLYWDEYRVEGLFQSGQVSCVTADGNAVEVDRDEKGAYTASLTYDADLQTQYADFVRRGMEAYACYIQDCGGIAAVAKYFDTSSLFYRNTRLNPQQWVITPSSYHFEDEKVDQFYAYSPDVFSCRVDMIQVLVRGGAEYRDHMVMTVFLHKVNGTFLIYDRTVE